MAEKEPTFQCKVCKLQVVWSKRTIKLDDGGICETCDQNFHEKICTNGDTEPDICPICNGRDECYCP